jgi:hypothetical protein
MGGMVFIAGCFLLSPVSKNKNIFVLRMLPDYPHKIFNDKRSSYLFLVLTLAMDTPTQS